jgi:hypothetical protein
MVLIQIAEQITRLILGSCIPTSKPPVDLQLLQLEVVS